MGPVPWSWVFNVPASLHGASSDKCFDAANNNVIAADGCDAGSRAAKLPLVGIAKKGGEGRDDALVIARNA